MSVCFPLRRIVVAVGLALLGVVGPAAAVRAGEFRASGTDTFGSRHGNRVEGMEVGTAQPGGRFTAVYSGFIKGYRVYGIDTWDFGGGHTLTWFWEGTFTNKSPITIGTYTVIGGTGRFANATGSCDWIHFGYTNGVGEWEIEGTVTFR